MFMILVPRPCPVFCCLQYGKVTHVGRDDLGLTTKVMSSVVLHNHSKMPCIYVYYTSRYGDDIAGVDMVTFTSLIELPTAIATSPTEVNFYR